MSFCKSKVLGSITSWDESIQICQSLNISILANKKHATITLDLISTAKHLEIFLFLTKRKKGLSTVPILSRSSFYSVFERFLHSQRTTFPSDIYNVTQR